tara:strand:+ start:302 stop:712 length:411 start_codon:yes stop_codon:yes gene_type:complete
MPTLIEIFNEAKADPRAIITLYSNRESVINKGCKIQKFSDRIEILNMGKGGDYFKVCTPKEYEYFYNFGWRIGVLQLAISNCQFKLNIIKERIKKEVNTRKNDKHIQNLKNRREAIMVKFTTYKRKLNQVKLKSQL